MNKLMLLPAFAAVLMMLGSVSLAEATHANWGYIKDGGSGVHPAKITFEKAGEYFWDDISSPGGYYYKQITPNGSTGWYIDAMADGYDRHAKTGQSEGASYNNFDISTRSENTINFKMAYDTTTGVTLAEARNELVSAEPWFEDEHGLVFNEWNSNVAWTSSGQSTTNCSSVKSHAESDANWSSGNYGSADILAVFSDGHMSSTSSKACADVPVSGGTHPSLYVDIRTSDSDYNRDRRVAHELTHNYGFSHLSSCTGAIPGLMSVTDTSYCDYIINWSPANDVTLENRRGWY